MTSSITPKTKADTKKVAAAFTELTNPTVDTTDQHWDINPTAMFADSFNKGIEEQVKDYNRASNTIVNAIKKADEINTDTIDKTLIPFLKGPAGKAIVGAIKDKRERSRLENINKDDILNFEKQDAADSKRDLANEARTIIASTSQNFELKGDILTASFISDLNNTPALINSLKPFTTGIKDLVYTKLNDHKFTIVVNGKTKKVAYSETNNPTERYLIRKKMNAAIINQLINAKGEDGESVYGDRILYYQVIKPLFDQNETELAEDLELFTKVKAQELEVKKQTTRASNINSSAAVGGTNTYLVDKLNQFKIDNPGGDESAFLGLELDKILELNKLDPADPNHISISTINQMLQSSGPITAKGTDKEVGSIEELNSRVVRKFRAEVNAFESERKTEKELTRKAAVATISREMEQKLYYAQTMQDKIKILQEYAPRLAEVEANIFDLTERTKQLITDASLDDTLNYHIMREQQDNNIYIDPTTIPSSFNSDQKKDIQERNKFILSEDQRGSIRAEIKTLFSDRIPSGLKNTLIHGINQVNIEKELEHIFLLMYNQQYANTGFKDANRAYQLALGEFRLYANNFFSKSKEEQLQAFKDMSPVGFEASMTVPETVSSEKALDTGTIPLIKKLANSPEQLNLKLDQTTPLGGEDSLRLKDLKKWVNGKGGVANVPHIYTRIASELEGETGVSIALRRAVALGIIDEDRAKAKLKELQETPTRRSEKAGIDIQIQVRSNEDQELPEEIYKQDTTLAANTAVKNNVIVSPYDYYQIEGEHVDLKLGGNPIKASELTVTNLLLNSNGTLEITTEENGKPKVKRYGPSSEETTLNTRIDLKNKGFGAFGIKHEDLKLALKEGIIKPTDVMNEETQKKIYSFIRFRRLKKALDTMGITNASCTNVFLENEALQEILPYIDIPNTTGFNNPLCLSSVLLNEKLK